MKGIVYLLTNEAMPGYVKIGHTSTSVEQRLKELYSTPVPLPFECFYAIETEDSAGVERALHEAFGDKRVSAQREFFQIEPERMVLLMQKLGRDVTPVKDYVESKADQRALDKARERKSVFNFAMVDVPVGAVLEWSRDPSIKAKVLDNRYISIQGETTSLSASAARLLGRSKVQGPLFWMYDGELLTERRERLERGEGKTLRIDVADEIGEKNQ